MYYSSLNFAPRELIESTISLLKDSLVDSTPRSYFINQCTQSQYAVVYDFVEGHEYITGLSQDDAFTFLALMIEVLNDFISTTKKAGV